MCVNPSVSCFVSPFAIVVCAKLVMICLGYGSFTDRVLIRILFCFALGVDHLLLADPPSAVVVIASTSLEVLLRLVILILF